MQRLPKGFSESDTIDAEEKFAKTTAGNVNFHIYIDTDDYCKTEHRYSKIPRKFHIHS